MGSPDTPCIPKRRKIRKGTTSCWECKRRKVRCSLVDDPGLVCAACRRRGTKCLTQDLPDEVGDRARQPVNERIGRVEALIDRLVQETPTPAPARELNTHTRSDTPVTCGDFARNPSVHSDCGLDAPADEASRDSAECMITISSPRVQNPYIDISRELHASLPPREDIRILCEAGAHISIAFDVAMMVPYSDWERTWSDGTESLLEVPALDAHPVLLARYIFRLVRVLQHLDFRKSSKQIVALSDSPQGMSKRLAETAIRLVTTRDELLNTIEGLECVVMEACYHMNCGNSRPAWTATRRAMALAQVMNLHRSGVQVRSLEPHYKADTSFLWYRIVQLDRVVCLFMGLPQGSMDRSMASERAIASDTPLGRLERLHCAVASRILERNDADPTSDMVDTLKSIDSEINKAAEMMPSGWWMPPTLTETTGATNTPLAVVWDMLRLVAQICHFGLINQLHIPFMLGFTGTDQLHMYSQTTCISASREVLTRYVALRSFNRVAFSCRMADFFAMTAALLLLVGYIRQHSVSSDFNFLVHQRQGDRAMVQKAISHLQEIGWVIQDKIIAMSADILNRLLDIEAEAAKGRIYTTQTIHAEEAVQDTEISVPPGASILRVCVPSFGKVQIVHEGVRSDEGPATAPRGETGGLNPQPLQDPFVVASSSITTSQHVTGNYAAPLPSPAQQWYSGLGSNIGIEEYTFPGLDLAFCDGLIREPIMLSDANTSFQ
ncbi:hypothetical protein BJY01DRAFT_93261 [Aspergillus pseudoustus]|uniref:Zn(2)-C6 fungal-type domain-containing protein n=1 Tax=Aspergillus pseudoustus TaxID=1810923 RepID=A0ABR4J376_9EURO